MYEVYCILIYNKYREIFQVYNNISYYSYYCRPQQANGIT